MKTRILSALFLSAFLGVIFLTTTSEDTGYFSNGLNCGGGGCHGSALNVSTTVALTGLPANYIPGNTYALTFTINNISNPKAGFNILTSAGTFTAGTGSKVNGPKNQITHSTPMTAVSNISTFSFSWTAPTAFTLSVTFVGVGNAVDGTGGANSADQWNTVSETVNLFPASINDLSANAITCYPNPANDYIIAEGINRNAQNISVVNLYGQRITPVYTFHANDCKIDCSRLASGIYFLSAEVDGKKAIASFVKK